MEGNIPPCKTVRFIVQSVLDTNLHSLHPQELSHSEAPGTLGVGMDLQLHPFISGFSSHGSLTLTLWMLFLIYLWLR